MEQFIGKLKRAADKMKLGIELGVATALDGADYMTCKIAITAAFELNSFQETERLIAENLSTEAIEQIKTHTTPEGFTVPYMLRELIRRKPGTLAVEAATSLLYQLQNKLTFDQKVYEKVTELRNKDGLAGKLSAAVERDAQTLFSFGVDEDIIQTIVHSSANCGIQFAFSLLHLGFQDGQLVAGKDFEHLINRAGKFREIIELVSEAFPDE